MHLRKSNDNANKTILSTIIIAYSSTIIVTIDLTLSQQSGSVGTKFKTLFISLYQ